jgi:hyperosmotically inducible periplasmic protein
MKRLVLLSLLFALTAGAVAQTKQTLQSGSTLPSVTASEPVISSNGPVVAGFGKNLPASGDPKEVKIAEQVRHQLLMLPYYSLFDDLEYSVQGRAVTLSGSVTSIHSQTKRDAQKAVEHIEGVESVVNNIQVLPPGPFDEQLRRQVYAQLVRSGGLSQYFWQAAPSIHIIVLHQNITLKGYVDTTGDKYLAAITAKEIPSAFKVEDDLQVVK